nr:hypothetical protein [Pedobacter kyonggii]
MAKTVFHFRGCRLHKPLFINPIGTDADFPSKLAGGKAGLKLPRNAALSFSNHKEIMLKMS